MKLFTSNHGAVSVFLVIILVPTIIVTSLFVDVSRMFLGKSVAESAGDLALNSQLSQFDKELNEMYGLFAKAQSVDDVKENLDKYFESCMVSAGVNVTDADEYGSIISDILGDGSDEDISDLLQIGVTEDAAISAVSGANLGNPEVLKNQIVSFMKYRGPIDITKNLLGNITEVKNKTEISKEEADVTDDMNDYYEMENDVLEHLKNAYLDIKKYTDESGMTESYVNSLKTNISALKDNYEKKYIKMFKDQYNTQGIKIDFSDCTYKSFNYYKRSKTVSEKNAKKKFEDYLSDAFKKMDSYETAKRNVESFINEFYSNSTINSADYRIQWYEDIYQKNRVLNNAISGFYSALDDLNKSMAILVNAHEKLDDEFLDGTPSEKFRKNHKLDNGQNGSYSDFYDELYETYSKIYKGKISSNNISYEKTVSSFVNAVSDVYNNEFVKNTSTDESNQYFKDTANYLNSEYENIKKAKDMVTDAINDLDKALKSYNDKNNGFDKTFSNWKNSLDNTKLKENNSEVRSSSLEVMNDTLEKEFREKVTADTINALKTRIQNIEKLLDNMLEYIDGVKFNNTKVKNIKSYSDFKKAARVNEDEIVRKKSALDTNAQNSWNNNNSFTNPNVSIEINNNNNPDISVNEPDLYKYLRRKFAELDENDSVGGWKKQYNELKKENKKDPEDDEDSGVEGAVGDDISDNEISFGDSGGGVLDNEKGSGKSKISKAADSIAGLFSGIGDAIENPTTIRDDLYLLDYAMNMFSYTTYNAEGMYNLALSEGKSGLDNISTVKSLRSEYKSKWENEEKTFTDNKSLTNFMINDKNNYSFGNEIEYIINGGTNAENRSAIFGKIFLIRFVCNLAPEFSGNWNSRPLIALASAINGACPFIPVPLVKLVVILALTAAESGYDLQCLKEGMKVEFIKSEDDIVFTLNFESKSSDPSNWKGSKTTINKNSSDIKGFQYSDYLTVFLFINLVNDTTSNDTVRRMGDVIARNVGMYKGYDNAETIFSMNDAVTYYNLKTKIKVSPLFLSLPITQSDMNKVDSVSWWTWDYSINRGYN